MLSGMVKRRLAVPALAAFGFTLCLCWLLGAPSAAARDGSDAVHADECLDTLAASRWLVSPQMQMAIDGFRQSLIDAGHSDLEADLPPVDFRTLLDAAPFDTLSASARAKLARTAALHGRLDILLPLIESGADPSLGNGSVPDDLAVLLRSAPSHGLPDYAAGVGHLVAARDRPYRPSSPAKQQFRLPDAMPPALHDSTLAVEQGPALEKATLELIARLQDWSSKVDAAEALQRNCLDSIRSTSAIPTGPRD